MAKEIKRFFGQKISFESIKQPQPDNSPTHEDFSESDNNAEQELRCLKAKIEKNNKVTPMQIFDQLQHKYFENLIKIKKMNEEKEALARRFKKFQYVQQKKELMVAKMMSLKEYKSHSNVPDYTYEDLLSLQDNIGYVKVGLSTETINSIPMTHLEKQDSCSICLYEGEYGKVLPCGHFFHKECIDQWLSEKKNCPLCLSEVIQY